MTQEGHYSVGVKYIHGKHDMLLTQNTVDDQKFEAKLETNSFRRVKDEIKEIIRSLIPS